MGKRNFLIDEPYFEGWNALGHSTNRTGDGEKNGGMPKSIPPYVAQAAAGGGHGRTTAFGAVSPLAMPMALKVGGNTGREM